MTKLASKKNIDRAQSSWMRRRRRRGKRGGWMGISDDFFLSLLFSPLNISCSLSTTTQAQEEHLNAVCSFLHEAPQHTGSGLPTVAEAAVGGRRNISEFHAWGFSIPVSGSRTTGTGICSGPGTSSPTLDL